MTFSSELPDIDIAEALAYLVSNGLTATYYPDEAKIRGGTGLFEVEPHAIGYLTRFSMDHLENSWIVHTSIGQIHFEVSRLTLSSAVKFVVHMYEETDQFDDASISIDDSLKQFAASNLDARFETEKKDVIQICFGDWREDECFDGIVIYKRGSCFFAIRFCRLSPMRKLVCAGETLLEVVESLCLNSHSLRDCP